ncbi:MAG: glycosyltransferase family 4 protein [Rhizobacter sp.]|nr:glycosyltransferase family 4 protein [Chlorobiales bacterium]
MNIGFVQLGEVSKDSGGRNYFINFVAAFAAFNREHHYPHRLKIFITAGEAFLIEKFLGEHITVVSVPFSGGTSAAKVFGEQVVLPVQLLFSGLDVVYFPGNFASLLSPKPTVVAIRSMLYYHYPEAVARSRRIFRGLLTPPSAKRSQAIITPSQDIKNDVVKFVGTRAAKIFVVPHGINKEMFQTDYAEAKRAAVMQKFGITKRFILYASALWRYKNQDKLILAFAELLKHGFDGQLVIAGQGINAFETYAAELSQLVSELHLEGKVIFTGHLPHEELKYLYKYAALFAYPSGYESFGNPLFEAWAAGTPVVCANVHSFPEITLNGSCALMCDPTDVAALTSAMQQMLTDEALRNKFIDAGLRRIESVSWQKCVAETLTVLTAAAH